MGTLRLSLSLFFFVNKYGEKVTKLKLIITHTSSPFVR